MSVTEKEALECFGVGPKDERCEDCEYRQACDVCLKMPDKKINLRMKGVSYDRFSFSSEVASKDDTPLESIARREKEKERREKEQFTIDDLKRVVNFLLRVDDYSYAILSEIVMENHTTASGVARKFGVSRQAMHRKIRDACVKYPELRQMLRVHLHRCKRIQQGVKTTARRKNRRDGAASEKTTGV